MLLAFKEMEHFGNLEELIIVCKRAVCARGAFAERHGSEPPNAGLVDVVQKPGAR
jgi:hypothetical protein